MTMRAIAEPWKRLWLVFVACLMVLGFTSLPALAEDAPGTVKGAVMRTPGGALAEAITNARIDIHPLGDDSVWYRPVTDSNGHYQVILPDGTYQVTGIYVPADNRWYPQWKQFNVSNGLLVESNQLWFELPYPVTGNVQGQITTEYGGFAAGKTVWIQDLVNNTWLTTTTNVLGEFGVDLPDGQYRLAKVPGYYFDRFFTVTNGQSDAGKFHLQMPGKSLSGRLLDGTQPVVNQNIVLYRDVNGYRLWYTVTTDSDGNFYGHFSDGLYELNGIWDDATSQMKPVRRSIEIKYGSTNPNPYIIDMKAVPVTGNVIYEGNQAPVDQVQIHAHSADYSTWYSDYTDASGNFTLHLPDGDYQVDTAWYDNSSRGIYQTFTVQNGQLVGNLVIEIPVLPEGNVQGHVIDNSGALMRKSRVLIEDMATNAYLYTFTNASGQFGLNLPDGQYRLSDVNDYRVDVFFTVAGGELQGSSTLPIILPPLSLQGQLLDNGTPLANTEFNVYKEINGTRYWYALLTDENGNFSRHLADGVYVLQHIYLSASDEWRLIDHSIQVLNGKTNSNPYLLDITTP